ncbi:hypothetical protein XENORESO_013616 [Xenotaenia resolanae]|uniref:Uncharacterized protein n=1 Tax=Xenotaenia resolanae TaxID=208358 RepID=A0ABV0VVC1_9TELE
MLLQGTLSTGHERPLKATIVSSEMRKHQNATKILETDGRSVLMYLQHLFCGTDNIILVFYIISTKTHRKSLSCERSHLFHSAQITPDNFSLSLMQKSHKLTAFPV